MEFSLTTIKHAQQLYTGVEFPILVAAFAELGITQVTINIHTGETTYQHRDGMHLQTPSLKATTPVASTASQVGLTTSLQIHQQGKSDFPTFCEEIAAAGIAYWIIDVSALTCDYYSLIDALILSETIPKATLPNA